MNYLLLSTMMVAAIDGTFGRGCDCCKKLCADKDSSGPSSNSEDKEIIVNEKTIKWNEDTAPTNMKTNTYTNENNLIENIGNNNNFYNTNKNNNTIPENLESNDNSNHKKIMHDEKFNSKKVNENEETLYFKIDKDANDENIKKCFNNKWYEACKNKVLLLQEVNENDTGVLSVTGSDNKLEITDQGKKVLGEAGCKPEGNKWIIVKVITLNEDLKSAGDSYIFYVDDITSIADEARYYGVFENINCYSIKIIAANTRAVKSMMGMFLHVNSALEQDTGKDTGPGLIGLDKLNVENVEYISIMFGLAIRKQATLDQLGKWQFSGKNKVVINFLFYSQVEGLNFKVLDGWSNSTGKGTVSFMLTNNSTSENVFVSDEKYKFTAPDWFKNIVDTK